MEIEWGGSRPTREKKIIEDFLRLVQARADIRVMVFQCNDVLKMTDRLIDLAEHFEGVQQGDRYFFAGWDLNVTQNTNAMRCRCYRA